MSTMESNTEPKLTDWAEGPPPCVGWWNASVVRDPDCRRWWDGKCWSRAVWNIESEESAERAKRVPFSVGDGRKMEYRGLAERPAA